MRIIPTLLCAVAATTSGVPAAAQHGELPRDPIELEPVNVVARPDVLSSHGFHRRREAGVGSFFTRRQIEEMRPRTMGDLLRRVPGLSVAVSRYGATARSRAAGAPCPMQYYLDGVGVPALNVDFIPPEDVEGLEIYRGAASIPAEFNRGTALCGVILIWTRVN